MKSRLWGPFLLGLAVVGGFGAWLLWPRGDAGRPRAATANDDLELLAALVDAGGAREAARDVLVAGPGADVYLARASDRVVVAVPKAGGAPRTLAHLDAPAAGMALAGGALWIASGHALSRLALAGGDPVVVARGLKKPRAVAADGAWSFVVDVDATAPGLVHESAIVRVPAAGGDATVLGRCKGDVADVALDDTNAYWADPLEGTVLAVPKTGGEPRALATERGLPAQVLAHGGALYWVEKRSESVWTMPASGGAPRRVTQDFAGFENVVVDVRGVWWSSEAAVDGAFRVLSAPLAGGDPAPASGPLESVDALASDGAHVYWARDGVVSRADGSD